jgi:hypothetical protein
MAIVESKLSNGTLSLGPTATKLDFSCQITNARVTTSYEDDGDPLTTLCGDNLPAGRKMTGQKLEGTFVQDFDEPDGIIGYLWDNNLAVVDFEFIPNDVTTGATLTGQVMLEIPAETYGGDVKTRLTSDFAWNIQGAVTRSYGAGTMAKEPVSA